MTQHNHPEVVPGCFRCDLSADESPIPYYEYQSKGMVVTLDPDPLSDDGDLVLSVAFHPITLRVRMSEAFMLRLADAIHRWYASPVTATDEMVATDLTEGTDHGA